MQVGNSHPLLSTKLYIPPARPGRVPRARLIERLNGAIQSPLTLICGPAGYGKTTLLSEWIPQNEHCVTWVSLDEGDNDPMRFWRYFIAALQTLNPRLCKSAERMLESAQTPQIEPVLSLAINELAALDFRFSHVFDDYHLVENPAIDSSLAFLVEHLPQNVNLVISSRSDPALPLARWRARQQMAEIRSADLRFTIEETTGFLNQAMKLNLSAAEIAALEARTEGWIAGLQLAALSIKDHADRAGFISAFTGSHRFIIDYLVEEVLSRQPQSTREFLLSTSILNRLNAPLCDALTGGSSSQSVLEKLEQDNLFVMPLDDQRRWYRYHHLFAEVLQARLRQRRPGSFVEMHRRASHWFEREGLVDQAFRHALAAPDLERAAGLVERNSIDFILRSEVLLIRSWLEQLPDELVKTRPRLILAHGWILVLTGHGQLLEQWLAAPGAAAVLTAPDLPDDILGELALLRATLARFQRKMDLSLQLARQALGHLPDDDRGLLAGAMYTIGTGHFQKGETDSASKAFTEAVRLGETKGGPYMALLSLQELSEIQIRQGKLTKAIQTCQQAKSMAARLGWEAVPAAGMAHIYSGQVLYEQNDLAKAAQEISEGVDLLQSSIEQFVLAQGFSALALVQQASGDTTGAFATIQCGKDWFRQMQIADTGAGNLLDLGEIQVRIGMGELNTALQWFETCQWRPDDTRSGYLQAVIFARLRLAQHRQRMQATYLQEGLEITDRLMAAAEAKDWFGDMLELLVLRALFSQAQDDLPGAISSLERALSLAEPEGYVRIFVDEGEPMRLLLSALQTSLIQRSKALLNHSSLRLLTYLDDLMAAFSLSTPAEKTGYEPWFEPLSERELEILHLIASGRTNQEIAQILVIAVSTVKTHINHLYGKLGTHRRTHAIAIARDLGLLSE